MAQEFKNIRMNTMYSFGLDENEFVNGLETDRPENLADFGMRLGEVENSRSVLNDTPCITAPKISNEEIIERLG